MSLSTLQRRILDISYRHRLSHLGSCIGMAELLDLVYQERKADEPVILSAGHAGLALYCVLEKYEGRDAEDLFARHGVHPHKAAVDGIWCTSGSLGQGITVAVGRALANRDRRVWCLTSDGEMAEGSVYEALSFAREAKLTNLRLIVHANGYSAYRGVDPSHLTRLVFTLLPWARVQVKPVEAYGIPFLTGLDAHYYQMNEQDWSWVEVNS